MSNPQAEPQVDPRTIPVVPPESDDQRYIIYQGVNGMPMHGDGYWYFAPRSFNITRGRFSASFEAKELAVMYAELWAARFQDPNKMQW